MNKNTVQTRLSIDRITALDFIAIYGKDFGVSEYNLHGDNDYRFSEYGWLRYPTVIMSHGFPGYTTNNDLIAIAKWAHNPAIAELRAWWQWRHMI